MFKSTVTITIIWRDSQLSSGNIIHITLMLISSNSKTNLVSIVFISNKVILILNIFIAFPDLL
uniref:Uncharacterized protein LOC105113942 n=1 Tax=Rhizophora mucronata TaxID=61149 RepID=A0A2P2QZF3_RHIMU